MSFEYHFSSHLFEARQHRTLSQQAVANAVGISMREYQNIESGRVLPRVQTFLRLVFFFDLDIKLYKEDLEIHASVYPC